jgi:WD40 repeat protein
MRGTYASTKTLLLLMVLEVESGRKVVFDWESDGTVYDMECRNLQFRVSKTGESPYPIWTSALNVPKAHDHPIYALTYTHSGAFFLSADNSGALKYFTPTINNLTTIPAHREACRAISFSPNDEKFATGGDDGAIKVWTFGEAREDKVLSGHGWDVRSLEWHPSKGLIVSGSKDLLVKFWDPRMGKDISTL